MKFAKKYFTNEEPIEFLSKCHEKNSEVIKKVLKNNSYLLKKYHISQKHQIKELRENGIRISASGISRYKHGVYKTCSLTYLQIFSQYWFIPLFELMHEDYKLSEELKSE